MREIKFRAWDTEHKKMRGHTDAQTIQAVLFHNDYKGRVNLMQYTGLKDKQGKEIYEGDIVRGIFYKNEPEIGMVEWFEKGGRFSVFGYPMNIDGLHDVEIIGNIYENPELLKEAKI